VLTENNITPALGIISYLHCLSALRPHNNVFHKSKTAKLK